MITIPVKMDKKTFRRFAFWDSLVRRRMWLRPAVFSAIMIAFAIVCFMLRREQSALIGTVLFVIGIGLPLVYFGTFLSQVNVQAERLKLEKPRAVYTVHLTEEGFEVHNDLKKEENLTVPWADTFTAHRARKAIYLYASAQKAFILPDGQADVSAEDVWDFIHAHRKD